MILCRSIGISMVFLLLFSGLVGAQEQKTGTLSPEETQLIYDTLLPKESQKPGTKDDSAATMTVKRMARILHEENINLQGKDGQWQFFFEGMQMFLLTDSASNRIRIITPLARLDVLRQNPDFSEIELLQKMMRANYLATGDVRLCMNKNILWAGFMHPLDSLTERDFLAALGQLAETVRKTRSDVK